MNYLPELDELQELENLNVPCARFKTLDIIKNNGVDYPIKAIIIGSEDSSKPTLGLFGGVHGLERIGSQVVIAYLQSLFQQLSWDKHLQKEIQNYRIVSIPIINPAGMACLRRSNPNNVDLMRNAPVEAEGKVLPLVSGHRIGPMLPWYRGQEGVLEKEVLALLKFIREEMYPSKVSIALDIHSGFGVRDQIWYPYAKKKGDFPLEKEAIELKGLLDRTYPHHIYKFEPQSLNYLTHGDLWDYIFDLQDKASGNTFLPLTLELGSWNWVKKNPLQFFTKTGLFHPIKKHRHSRIMRRHLLLLNFLLRTVNNNEAWVGNHHE